jgi:hypothetical protein
MTAKHLAEINPNFDIGVVYHLTEASKVDQLLVLVDKYARPYGPHVMEKGTAFLRLNINIRRANNSAPWSMTGGALSRSSMSEEIAVQLQSIEANNPTFEITNKLLTAWVLNEWDRYSVVFELNVTVEDK